MCLQIPCKRRKRGKTHRQPARQATTNTETAVHDCIAGNTSDNGSEKEVRIQSGVHKTLFFTFTFNFFFITDF